MKACQQDVFFAGQFAYLGLQCLELFTFTQYGHTQGALRAQPGERTDQSRKIFFRAKPARCNNHRSEEHTYELQSIMRISSAVFCLTQQNSSYSINANTTHPT